MIQARAVRGRFRTLRGWAYALLTAVLFAVPWLRVGGNPLVLFDIPERKFYVFGLVIFPQELYFLWLLLALLALALFFFTSLLGRVWCGWACPQTVFTDVYAAVARRIQGWKSERPPAEIALWRRVATHGVWLALSWVIGFHLIAYFVSPYELIGSLIPERRVDTAAFGFHVAFTLVTYLDMGIVRQSFCRYLCPYARFQSVLFDRDTLVVGYDADRGEPRGKRGSTEGDCVDCSLCVQVCPTAIDIREGLQLECIACTQCIDACDGVMERLGRATNLIGYRSLRSLEGGGPVRLLRPRVVVYGTSIALVIVAFVALVQTRVPLGLTVTHNRDSLYSQGADGRVGNAFDLRLENRDRVEHVLRLRLEEPGFELVAGQNPVTLAPISALDARVFVMAPHDGAKVESLHVVAESIEADGPSVVRPAHFLRPVGNPAAGMETKHGS